MGLDLGGLREWVPFFKTPSEKLPKAHYLVPVPEEARKQPTSFGVSFLDKDTMRPRRVGFLIGKEGIRCSLPPMVRVEIRIMWIEDDQLEMVRYVLGPASKFRVRVDESISEDMM